MKDSHRRVPAVSRQQGPRRTVVAGICPHVRTSTARSARSGVSATRIPAEDTSHPKRPGKGRFGRRAAAAETWSLRWRRGRFAASMASTTRLAMLGRFSSDRPTDGLVAGWRSFFAERRPRRLRRSFEPGAFGAFSSRMSAHPFGPNLYPVSSKRAQVASVAGHGAQRGHAAFTRDTWPPRPGVAQPAS